MTKEELVDKLNELFTKVEDIEGSAKELYQDIKTFRQAMEDLPAEVNDIEEDKKDE